MKREIMLTLWSIISLFQILLIFGMFIHVYFIYLLWDNESPY